MVLVDTNILIHAADPAYPTLLAWFGVTRRAVSSATRVEALGYHGLTTAEEAKLLVFFAAADVFPISIAIEDEAIRLRRQRRMKLGDSLIAATATAVAHGFDLATRNLRDFAWIPGLTVFDPS